MGEGRTARRGNTLLECSVDDTALSPASLFHSVTIEALCGVGRIENEYGIRDLPWIGPALRHLDLSHNAWLATHHAYGLLGANDGSGAAVNPGGAGASFRTARMSMSNSFFIHHR